MATVRPVPMTVVFHRMAERPSFSWWEAEPAGRSRFSGGHMPIGRGVIPHDLVHLATEAGLGLEFGFWGLLAELGTTFDRLAALWGAVPPGGGLTVGWPGLDVRRPPLPSGRRPRPVAAG